MAHYALNLPGELQHDAEQLALQQGVSLDQFILSSLAEKVGTLKRALADPKFPGIAYRRGASGIATPVLRGTNLRVQTVVIDSHQWKMTVAQIADEYDLPEERISEALAFYSVHQSNIDAQIAAENALADHRA